MPATAAMQGILQAMRSRTQGKLPTATDLPPYPVLNFAGGLNSKSSVTFLDRESRFALKRNQLTLCRNLIRTASGAMESRPGFDALNDTAVAPASGDTTIRDIFEFKTSAGVYHLLCHAGNTVFRWSGSAWVSIGTVATANTRIHWAVIQDTAVGFDGTNTPVYYDGSTFGTVSGSPPTTATIVVSHRNRLFALAGRTLYWCALSNIHDWTTANNAGSLPLPIKRGGAGTGAFSLWDRLILLAEQEVFQLVGSSPSVWELLPINTQYGHQGSPYGVMAAGNDVYFCDNKGVHALSVTLAQSETGDVEWDYESANVEPDWQSVDAANLPNVVAVHDSRRNLFLYICNTAGTNNAEAFVGDYYHLDDAGKPTWTRYTNFAFASACEIRSLQSGISEVLLGGYDGKVYRHLDSHLDDDGTAIPCQFQYVTDMEVPGWEKTWRWIVFYTRAAASQTLRATASFDYGSRALLQTADIVNTGDTIGSTFTIGVSALGSPTLQQHQMGIPGIGRSLTLNVAISATVKVRIGGFILYAGLRRTLNGRA